MVWSGQQNNLILITKMLSSKHKIAQQNHFVAIFISFSQYNLDLKSVDLEKIYKQASQ